MRDIKTFSREVTRRERINQYGKLGFVTYKEYFVGDNEDLTKNNYRKQIKFNEDNTVCVFKGMEKGKIYSQVIVH